MDITSLQYLEALYQNRSFIRAAEQIPMTTQGLRKAIHSLESELGIMIYTTMKNELHFTSAGLLLLEFGRKTITEYDKLVFELQKMRAENRNDVSVAFSIASFGVFAPHIAKWIKSVEDTQAFTYETMSEQDALNGVKNGRYDLAVTWGKPDSPIYHYQHLANIPLYACFSKKNKNAGKKELTIHDLHGERIIFFSEFQKPKQMITARCREEGIEPDFSISTPETMVMLTYLRQDLGISFILPHEIELYDREQFEAALVSSISFPIGITTLKTHSAGNEEKDFIRLLSDAVKEYSL